MTLSIKTVRDDQPLLDVVPLLSDAGLHHLPVVDAAGRLVGMMTQSDVIAGLRWGLARGAMERPQ
ncbi:MAG: CBS domain-containing protein [Candidatus Competibacter denitrificans]